VVDGTIGLVLAAGAGSRLGMPKALARTPEGEPWLARATAALSDGGCDDVVVVLGALAETALHLVPADADVVIARQWQRGLSASLLAGLDAVSATDSEAVLVTLVDLPELTAGAVRRVADGAGPADLRRAAYGGSPGHPVLLGRDHWAAVSASLDEDAGATAYLAAHGARAVDCTDLGGGDDVDEPVRGVA
jgi:CTP:molybdopterin cytidylyltransferase MocA